MTPLTARRALLVAATLCLSTLALNAQAQATSPVRAVATFSILGDLVQQVGGDRVSIEVLVGPGSDAHVYQPNPLQARAVAQANILFSNGLGFEGWLDRFLKSANYGGLHVRVSDGIKTIKGGHTHGHGHGHGHGHKHDHDTDPHAWQSVPAVRQYVANISKGLCQVDAAGCEIYRANAARFDGELQALDTEIRQQLAAIAREQRRVISSHDAFGYYAKEYGVTFLAPQGLSTDAEASARGVARLIRQIREQRIRALFVENVADARLIEQIARETGLTIAGRLYADSLSPQGGPAPDYLSLMRYNTRAIVQALSSKP
jgi:zinc/manganese transport system substrate-binding protein